MADGWRCAALMVVCAAAAGAVRGECLSDTAVAALTAQFLDKQPADNPLGLTLDDAQCTRAKFQRQLEQVLGRSIGYKVALAGAAAQQRFHHGEPVWGALYGPMLLHSGAAIDATFGARPMVQAGLLVRVSELRVNHARNPKEVLDGLDRVIPFIELSDLLVQEPDKLDGLALMAVNAGARLGVMGKPLRVERSAAFADALRDMQVVMLNDTMPVDHGKGTDVLGHPLNAVVWLVQELNREGRSLRKGDLISVGGFGAGLAPRPGSRLLVRYDGLPGSPQVALVLK